MEDTVKYASCIILGAMSTALGGFDTLLKCMLSMMMLDICCGFGCALVFRKSKYGDGGISSSAMIEGAYRKMMEIALVVMGVLIDKAMGFDYLRNCIVIYFIAAEGLSILEHMVVINVPFPKFIKELLYKILQIADEGDVKDASYTEDSDKE